jgi:hypothetical protein
MRRNPRFDAWVAKFWYLVRKEETGGLNFESYSILLTNIYIALLPNYRKKEMKRELEEEWLIDS